MSRTEPRAIHADIARRPDARMTAGETRPAEGREMRAFHFAAIVRADWPRGIQPMPEAGHSASMPARNCASIRVNISGSFNARASTSAP